MAGVSIKLNKKPTITKAKLLFTKYYIKKDRTPKPKVTSNFNGNNSGIGFNLLISYGL